MTGIDEIRSQVAAAQERLVSVLRSGKSSAGIAGKILRAHLVVENCLRSHLQVMNPNLGPVEELGLSFDKLRAAVVGLRVGGAAWANEELRTLNKIRNKLAHRLDTEISLADVAPLRKNAEALLRDSVARDRLTQLGDSPSWIVVMWALFFGTALALDQALEHHKNDLEARRRELDAAGAQLLRDIFADGTEEGGPDLAMHG